MCEKLVTTAQRLVKLAVVGAGAVGKSTLIARLATGTFINKEMTVGFDIESWTITTEDDHAIKVAMFDFGGQQQFRFFQGSLMTGAKAALLVFDCCSYPSLMQIEEWLPLLEPIPDEKKLLVGNKLDQLGRVPEDLICESCEAFGFDYILVSAMTGQNFDKLEQRLEEMVS